MSKQEILISSPAQFEAFLEHATNPWEPGCEIKTAVLANSTAVSCVLWDGMFYISGTDIVKALVYRFETSGRVIRNMKKFEEGVFSDLRNLKPGKDASLEEPRSEFLEFLHRNHCIRTQKKQKVFHWMAVPHEKLLQDSLDREIKRENDPELGLDAVGNYDGSVVIPSALTPSSSSTSLHLDAAASGHQRKRSLGNEIGSGKKIRQQGQGGKVVKAGSSSRRNSVKSSAASSRRTSTSSSPEEDNLEEEDGSSEDEAAAQLYHSHHQHQHQHQHLSYQHQHHHPQHHGIYRSASTSSLLSTASMTPLTSSPMFASSAPSSRPSSRPSSAPSTPAISSLYSMHLSSPFIHSYFTPTPPSLVSLGSTDSLNQHLEEATIYHSGSSSPYSSPLQDYSTNPAELYQEQEDGSEQTSAFDPLGQAWGDEPNKEALAPSKEQLSCQFSIPSNACPTPPPSSSSTSSTSSTSASASSASSTSAAHLRSHEEAADACGGDDDSSFPTGGVAAHTHSTHTLDPVLSVRSTHTQQPSAMKFQPQIPQHFNNAGAGQGAAFRPFSVPSSPQQYLLQEFAEPEISSQCFFPHQVNFFTQYEPDYSYDLPTVIPSFVNQPSAWTNSYDLPTSQLQQQQGAPHTMAQGQPQHPNTARGARPQQVSFGPY